MEIFHRIQAVHLVMMMLLLAIINIYMMRNCLSITLTQMVKPNANRVSIGIQNTCPMKNHVSMSRANSSNHLHLQTNKEDRFDWSEDLQGIILGAFFIGYIVFQIPNARLAERTNAKYVAVAAQAITVVITFITPTIVWMFGGLGLVILRIILGVFQAGFFASITAIISTWVPAKRRGVMGSVVFNGLPLGSIISNYFSGLILHTFAEWPIVFYCFGSAGLVITVLFFLLCSKDPASHPFITDTEKQYLEKEIGKLERNKATSSAPWKAMITNPPLLALMSLAILGDWSFFVVVIDLPKYMNDILHVSIKDNGLYSSIPYCMWILATFAFGYLSDWLIATDRLTITNARKVFTAVASFIDACFMIAASYAGCNALVVGCLFAVAVASQGVQISNLVINVMDLSPNYTATISGMIGAIGSTLGILAPVIVGFLTPHSSLSEWRSVFWLTLVVQFIKVIIYSIWGSGEVQAWNEPIHIQKAHCNTDTSSLSSSVTKTNANSNMELNNR